MKKLSMILALSLLVAACGEPEKEKKEGEQTGNAGGKSGTTDTRKNDDDVAREDIRYFDVESGILTLDLNDGEGTQEIYFDDYGRRQAVYRNTTVAGQAVRMGSITEDGWIYRFQEGTNEGTKVRADVINASPTTDLGSLTDEEKKKYSYKALEPRTILGRETQGHAATMGNTSASVWLWKKIPLLLIMTSAGSTEVLEKLEAVKLEVEVDVPEEKFNLPKGVEFTDLTSTIPQDTSGAGK